MIVPDHSEGYLLVTNRLSILSAELNLLSFTDRLPIHAQNVVAITANMRGKTIYWSDITLNKIMSVKEQETPKVVYIILFLKKKFSTLKL